MERIRCVAREWFMARRSIVFTRSAPDTWPSSASSSAGLAGGPPAADGHTASLRTVLGDVHSRDKRQHRIRSGPSPGALRIRHTRHAHRTRAHSPDGETRRTTDRTPRLDVGPLPAQDGGVSAEPRLRWSSACSAHGHGAALRTKARLDVELRCRLREHRQQLPGGCTFRDRRGISPHDVTIRTPAQASRYRTVLSGFP
jgi:hypothetical protein